MIITRIDEEKDLSKEAERITFEHNGNVFTISVDPNGIRVRKHEGTILIRPICSNVIIIVS